MNSATARTTKDEEATERRTDRRWKKEIDRATLCILSSALCSFHSNENTVNQTLQALKCQFGLDNTDFSNAVSAMLPLVRSIEICG